jgi:nicotinate-nucleotide adenylyltransferase
VLGGTFDPIHFGHLRMAEELAEVLNLAEIRIIPAGQPPHRAVPRTPAAHRLEMTRLAISGNPRFKLDDREVRQARASYTVDTLADLRKELGPEQAIWLLMGADAFLGLTTWKEWQRLFELAHIAVAHRPGYALLQSDSLNAELRQELENRLLGDGGKVANPSPFPLPPSPAGSILLQPITQLGISATDIRARLQEGRSVRYLTPDSVLDYIQKNHLYLPA